jgi:hypothetical protein
MLKTKAFLLFLLVIGGLVLGILGIIDRKKKNMKSGNIKLGCGFGLLWGLAILVAVSWKGQRNNNINNQ